MARNRDRNKLKKKKFSKGEKTEIVLFFFVFTMWEAKLTMKLESKMN